MSIMQEGDGTHVKSSGEHVINSGKSNKLLIQVNQIINTRVKRFLPNKKSLITVLRDNHTKVKLDLLIRTITSTSLGIIRSARSYSLPLYVIRVYR